MNIDAIKTQLAVIRNSTAIIDNLLVGSSIIKVKAGDNLLSILDAAPADSVISIDPSFALTADIKLTKPVTLMSCVQSLKRPDLLAINPTITGSIVALAPRVSLLNLSIIGAKNEATLITTGDDSTIDGCIIKGSHDGQHRAILANSKNVNILRSHISNIWDTIDTQAICAYDRCKNLVIDDCYLEASGENILFGGADASSIDNLPQFITVNNCDLFKPVSWKGKLGITVKNLFEIKAGKDIKVTNCRMSNSWTSGQDGYGILINVRNQGGSASFTVIEDVIISDCVIDNLGAGLQILGKDSTNPSGTLKRVTLRNNKFTNINGGRQIFIQNGSEDLTLDGNVFTGKDVNSALSFDNPAIMNTRLAIKNNTFDEGDYGIVGTDAPSLGKAVLEMYAPGYTWTKNSIKKGTSGRNISYPVGTSTV